MWTPGPHCSCPDGLSFQHMQNITFQTESSVAAAEEFQSPKYIFHSFMERLWAYLTIQQLLEQMWVAHTLEGPLARPRSLGAASSPPWWGRRSWHKAAPGPRDGLWHRV